MTDIFVSYSRKDKELVKKLVEVLTAQGWTVWWDPTIRAGEYFEDVIEQALYDCKCVIVVWSHNSVKSKWVRAEAAEAANRDVMVPVVIDDARIPFRFKQIQEARLSDWQFTPDHPELTKLLESISQKFVQSKDADAKPLISNEQESEAIPAPRSRQKVVEQQSARTSIDVPPEENNDARTPYVPEPRQSTHGSTNVSRSQFVSKNVFVAALVVIIGIAGVLIYLFASRGEPTNKRNDGQQASAGNSSVPSPSTAPSASASPGASPTTSPAGSPGNARRLSVLLKGQWQSQTVTNRACECSSSACLDIQFTKPVSDFCIESNNVYVSAFYKLDAANNKAYLFFRSPGDLGAGAGQMPWDKFDRTKPLATIDVSDIETQKLIYVTWHGFTESGAARQRWRQVGSGFQGTYLKR